jgi:Domain of unknown function (DUF4267)
MNTPNNIALSILSDSASTARTLPWSAVSTWLAILAAVVFLALGVRALLAPAGAAAFFGLPISDANGLSFVRVFGARNIGLSLLALVLIILDIRIGLAGLFLAAGVIAGLDAWIVTSNVGIKRAIKHFGYFVVLIVFGVWLL